MEVKQWEDCIKCKKTRILAIIMIFSNKNPPVYKEHVIYFIAFSFETGVTIIDFMANMRIYVSEIVESYKDKTFGHFENAGTAE